MMPDSAQAFGVVLTAMWGTAGIWENALLDRQADRPATIQIETWDDGDFAFRYDFSAASPTSDFFAGAQSGPAAVEALSIRGGVTNAAEVYRVDGAPVPDGTSVADLFAAPVLELRWKDIAGLGDLAGDTDGDGLTDWQEVFLHATDPAIPDTDGDGLRCSDDFPWHVRLTARNGGPDGSGNAEIHSRPGHASDNSAGSGFTNLEIDP